MLHGCAGFNSSGASMSSPRQSQPLERSSASLAHVLVCTSDRRMRSTIGGSRLERKLVLFDIDKFSKLPNFKQAESRSHVLKASSGTTKSSKILASSKSKDMEVQRSGRWANKKYCSCTESKSLNQAENRSARD